jgi:protein arginine kinase activator
MLCDDCRKKSASVYFKEISYGKIRELHLCEECAQKRGLVPDKKLSPIEILQKMLREKDLQDEKVICPQCYLSLAEFKRLGRFGCGKCLEAFEPHIKHLIKEVQNSERHIGRRPKSGNRKAMEIYKLREELRRALAKELYDEAAQIRDKLKTYGVNNVE